MDKKRTHIAVVDDDRDIRDPLAHYLTRAGFHVTTAADGGELDRVLATSIVDLIVLDIMLPGEDGLSICRRVQMRAAIPIILLTAVSDDADRIVGLEVGADDYVNKPFNPRELLARIKSVLRRSEMPPLRQLRHRGIISFEGWRFDFAKREVLNPDGIGIRLSGGEHLMLRILIEHAGTTLTRDQLLDLSRGRDAQLFDRSIDMQISRLRRKLGDDSKSPRIIVTEWGGGYCFAAEVVRCEP